LVAADFEELREVKEIKLVEHFGVVLRLHLLAPHLARVVVLEFRLAVSALGHLADFFYR
jgi:hypothetical protein